MVAFLSEDFDQLPEKQIAVSEDSTVYAQYARPTTRYTHGILGDVVEAGELVVWREGTSYMHILSDQYVFEDIRPRLSDVDGDGQVKVIAIRAHVDKGAGIAIYKVVENALSEFAWVEEIGRSSRWLNVAAIYDLDGDSTVELAWIQTPHIGGILRVAKIEAGELTVLAEASHYSNHAIGEINLCLSVVTQSDNAITLYVPSQDRGSIADFRFFGGLLQNTETIVQSVNFARSLASQYDFANVVQGGNNCVRP